MECAGTEGQSLIGRHFVLTPGGMHSRGHNTGDIRCSAKIGVCIVRSSRLPEQTRNTLPLAQEYELLLKAMYDYDLRVLQNGRGYLRVQLRICIHLFVDEAFPDMGQTGSPTVAPGMMGLLSQIGACSVPLTQ